jgi:hypothetical protein
MLEVSAKAGIVGACDHEPCTFEAYAEMWRKEIK